MHNDKLLFSSLRRFFLKHNQKIHYILRGRFFQNQNTKRRQNIKS